MAVLIGVVAALLFVYFRRERDEQKKLLHWLSVHRGAIEREGLHDKGTLVRPETQVTVYEATASFFLVTIRFKSRMYFPEAGDGTRARLVCSLASLLFGWWGVPWGPIWTLVALNRNLRGGQLATVGELVYGDAAQPIIAADKAWRSL